LIGSVDVEKGYLTLVSVSGKLKDLKIRGFVSSEQHTFATQGAHCFGEIYSLAA